MYPNRTFGLALVLAVACVARATVSQTALEPKESPVQLDARLQQTAPPVLQPAAPARGKTGNTVIQAPVAHPANAQAFPSKEERLADWRDLPALEAYRLFKELGRELPRELALQFNASLEVNVCNESLRQAGGTPMTAVVIPSTAPGDSYSDSGNTMLLSNYLTNVPYVYSPCNTAAGFQGNDAWYTFTLAAPTRVAANLCSGGYSFDTLLGIFTTSLEMVASNDDACGELQSGVDCCLEPGTYYMVVDGYSGGAGTYSLGVAFLDCPANPIPTRGGPDAFGYTWTITGDSQDTSFEWLDISAVGSAVTLTDDSYTEIPLSIPFPFRFYGLDYDQVYIGSNGLVGFVPGYLNSLDNGNLPDGSTPNAMIAAFWDDLNPGAGGTIHTYADPGHGRFIIQYTNVPSYPSTGSNTFQIVLNRGGDIVIHFQDLQDDDLAEATVGIENPEGTIGLVANLNGAGATIGDNRTVHFHHPASLSGSDAFGYCWESSEQVDGPVPYFHDIAWTSSLNIHLDDTHTTQALPFAFPFYGVEYNTVRVSSNGLLTFGSDGANSYSNGALPGAAAPNNLICAFWDDLNPEFGGSVHYFHDAGANRVIFQWQNLPHTGDYFANSFVSHFTFQAVLYADGTIDLNYDRMSGNFTGSATVGLENADGNIGLQAALNGYGARTADGITLRFRAPQPRPTRGGPAAGYEWVNSLDPAGPEVLFTDISGTGINLGLTGDDATVVTGLPFAFPFSGSRYTSVTLCTNGWLTFNPGTLAQFNNQTIPTVGVVDNAIFPFWDDLFFDAGSALYYLDQGSAGRVIFQWNQVAHFGGSGDGPYTFQVMLYSNGEIYLNYGNMGGSVTFGVGSATVGVENAGGTDGLQVNFNNSGGLIANGVTVAIAPVYRKPATITDLRIVQDAVTNGQPFLYHYEWSPVATDTNGNTLVVDHYDIYYKLGLDPYAPFPAGWTYLTPFFGTNTGTVEHSTDNIAVRVVAVDAQGFVVSGDANPGAAPMRAGTLRSLARRDDGTVMRLVNGQPLK